MSTLALIAGALCLGAWFYLLLGHGRFWMVWRLAAPGELRRGATRESGTRRTVAVVIPARNEADVIARAVASLLRQDNSGKLHVFVVDDNSVDVTAQAARAAAQPQPERLTVISGQPLAAGWSGKLWAVQQGVEQALTLRPDFLLITDADVEHAPGGVATLVAIADSGGYDLVSFMVKLHCRGLAEKLLIPAFVFFFFLLYPPEWIRDPRRRVAGAAGGCMLIRAETLDRIGGIAAIRGEIIDDCALARAVKRSGGKVWLGVTPNTLSLRPYNSFGEIERMIARSAFNQLRHSAALLLATVLGMLLLYVLPLALLATGKPELVVPASAACLLMVITYLPMVRFYGLNPLWALTPPFGALFYTVATIDSAWRYWSGRGGEWKGRAQDVAESKE